MPFPFILKVNPVLPVAAAVMLPLEAQGAAAVAVPVTTIVLPSHGLLEGGLGELFSLLQEPNSITRMATRKMELIFIFLFISVV